MLKQCRRSPHHTVLGRRQRLNRRGARRRRMARYSSANSRTKAPGQCQRRRWGEADGRGGAGAVWASSLKQSIASISGATRSEVSTLRPPGQALRMRQSDFPQMIQV